MSQTSECATKVGLNRPWQKKWKCSICAAIMPSAGSLLFQVWLLFSYSQKGSSGLAPLPSLLSKRLKSMCSLWRGSILLHVWTVSIPLITDLATYLENYTTSEPGLGLGEREWTKWKHIPRINLLGVKWKWNWCLFLQELPKVSTLAEARAESHIQRT